MTRSSSY